MNNEFDQLFDSYDEIDDDTSCWCDDDSTCTNCREHQNTVHELNHKQRG